MLANITPGFEPDSKTKIKYNKEQLINLDKKIRMDRFNFGLNWKNFNKGYDDTRLKEARQSLLTILEKTEISCPKSSFLDAGCGSGLFSAAAYDLGFNVLSIDYDSDSVEACEELKGKIFENNSRDNLWEVIQGDLLDDKLLTRLERFNFIYCWGVAHHTGDVKQALNNLGKIAEPGAVVCVSIYNFQPVFSKYWLFVKRMYNRSKLGRYLLLALHLPYPFASSLLGHAFKKAGYRGMDAWHDYLDWMGGLPFEPMRPCEVIELFENQHFKCISHSLVGRKHGCNEFVFILPTS